MLQDGEAEVMITGGAEAPITNLSFAGFCAARALILEMKSLKKPPLPLIEKEMGL